MLENVSFTNNQSGVRLDAALVAAFPATTKAFAREAVASGAVTVNGRLLPKGRRLAGGERIAVARLAEARDNTVAPNAAVDPHVIYADDALLGCDKPAGMPVQPLSHNETATLVNGIVARYPECAPLGDRPLLAGAVHRIDADTSGLILVARTTPAFAALRAQFAAQTVEKTYLALVEGHYTAGATLENDLAHDPSIPFCRMIDARHNRLCESERRRLRPLHAVTRYEPVGHTRAGNEERTLLRITIFTGVTHQIRAQLALSGIHIVNDRLYGAFAVENQTGHCLHAFAAAFVHPVTGRPLRIETPLPDWARLKPAK